MNEDKITKSEIDLLSTAINRILSSEILENDMSDQLPLIDNLSDSNKIYHGKASILFVDMRESTKLPEKFNTDQLVKIYRSYIRTIVQAIRYSGGEVRDFMGDGVLAVFVDNDEGSSEDKSVRAARYITTAVDKLLNPLLDQTLHYRISCGIGVHTGDISISKVGMKGRNSDTENEFGIAWIGNSTNLACKFSGEVDNGSIFISPSTYSALSNISEKEQWEKVQMSKGSSVLNGYIAKQHYLQIDNDRTPYPAGSRKKYTNMMDVLKHEYLKQLADITEKTIELGRKEEQLKTIEYQLNIKAAELNQKGKTLLANEFMLNQRVYKFHFDVIDSGFCKRPYAVEMGQSFWEEHLDQLITAGQKIGKDEHQIKQEISYAMVSIYQDLGIYDRAYDFLVEQAAGCSWINMYTVQTIVNSLNCCNRLLYALKTRVEQDKFPLSNKFEFEQIIQWLETEFKCY